MFFEQSREKLPVEKMGKDPLDMGQYKKIFGTCRIPGVKQDSLEYNPKSKHIIVMRNNNVFATTNTISKQLFIYHIDFQFFKLQVLNDNNQVLSEKQLLQQLGEIIKNSGTAGPEIGVLTADQRDAWGKAFQELIKGI